MYRKKILTLLILVLPFIGFGQDMKITWEDNYGREFSIRAISGNFGYSMIPGDRISYNYDDTVSKIGNVYIRYNYDGTVSKIGDVYIRYNYDGTVSKVGGLRISYTYDGKVRSTSGRVR